MAVQTLLKMPEMIVMFSARRIPLSVTGSPSVKKRCGFALGFWAETDSIEVFIAYF